MPIEVVFEVKFFSVSGITVRYLKIVDKSGYEGFPWFFFKKKKKINKINKNKIINVKIIIKYFFF